MIHDDEFRSGIDYTEGQRDAFEQIQALIDLIK